MISAYYNRLINPDPLIQLAAARIFIKYDLTASFLINAKEKVEKIMENDNIVLGVGRIFTHYCKNKFFLEKNELINNLYKIEKLPAIIINGRYDNVTKVKSGYELHQNWPSSKLIIVQDAGHSAFEPGTALQLIYASKKMQELIGNQY